ncbi:hypothetical protein OM427_27865, partial [Halomonas sp. 18H]
ETILDKAKKIYTEELGSRLDQVEKTAEEQTKKIDKIVTSTKVIVYRSVLTVIISFWLAFLFYALVYTSPESVQDLKSLGFKSIAFIGLVFITALNIIFGFKLIDFCKFLAERVGAHAAGKLRTLIDGL